LELDDDDAETTEAEIVSGGGSADGVGLISRFEDQPLTYHQIAVTGASEGFAYIQSRVLGTRPVNGAWNQDKKGHGELIVGLPELRVTQWSPKGISQCTTGHIVLDFNLPINPDSLDEFGSAINIYACGADDTECKITGSEPLPLEFIAPDPSSSQPITEAITRAVASSTLSAGSTYRVVVNGGMTGVLSANNKLSEERLCIATSVLSSG
jgi:hypothetical protein